MIEAVSRLDEVTPIRRSAEVARRKDDTDAKKEAEAPHREEAVKFGGTLEKNRAEDRARAAAHEERRSDEAAAERRRERVDTHA